MTYIMLFIVIIESAVLVYILRKYKRQTIESNRMKKHDAIMTSRFVLLNRWLEKKEEGISIAGYLQKKGIDRVGIYGLGTFAERLIAELAVSEIRVKYIIDKRFDLQGGKYDNIPVIGPDLTWKFPEVRIIIVTAYQELEEIKKNLAEKEISPGLEIKGLNEIIDEM